jgi:membrane-bound metal-dependent hydrolase YbcI (DUF457 family)
MYAGHFAAALALKAAVPKAPTWGLLVGMALPDLLCSAFLLANVEKVSPEPEFAPGFRLDFIDWSHSLVMTMVWAALFAALFWRHGRAVALAMGLAVFSHFPLDWVMHPGDLALYPHSVAHFGLGLWRTAPVGWWFVELAVVAAACAAYVTRARALRTFGGRALGVCAVMAVLHLGFSPWVQALVFK